MKSPETNKKPELLAPAGDFEKLQIAVAYGADAVYLSGTSFGLRAKAKNFNNDELAAAISYAHSHGVRVYVTANIFARNKDIEEMTGYFKSLAKMGADAFIVSDPGVLMLAKKEAPDVEIHISTQANTTNYASVKFWKNAGASRIILARELNLAEIAEIKAKICQEDVSILLEGFVHGAMCMSYSGRCMLSRYMTAGKPAADSQPDGARDANLGACAHPCRYNYRLYAEEASRPGYFMPVEESEFGTDIFSAEDLCMVEHIPALITAGLESFKIEGRIKTAFYVGLAAKAYRLAIDAAFDNKSISGCLDMLKMASHRPFSTGFYFDKPKEGQASYSRSHDFVGIVRDYNYKTGCALIEQRNVFEASDTLTFVPPKGENFNVSITEMYGENGDKLDRAPHARQKILLKLNKPVEELTLVCREIV